jgi:tRNA modification GTPase
MTHVTLKDTIAAIATPHGKSGIGIVRMSGPLCQEIAKRVFRPARSSHPLPSHKACYGWVVRPDQDGIIDEVIAIFMRAPHTYTREDCLELQSHGGPTVLREILHLVLSMGARLAEPGEFTLRAFLNGRIDLAQAEAVVDLIEAKTRTALEAAGAQLRGGLSQRVRAIKDKIVEVLSHLEVAIDFPEDEVLEEELDLEGALTEIHKSIDSLWESYQRGRILRQGASIMLIGPPNVGKSSLLNAMVGFERAIVTEIPGTTRDMVDAWIEWKGMPIRAIDTAGLRPPRDPIEEAGQRMLMERIEEADLIIWVLDGSQHLTDGDMERADGLTRHRPIILAINKSDLPHVLSEEELPQSLRERPRIWTSAKFGTGVEELLDMAREHLIGEEGPSEGLISVNERQSSVLARCSQRLQDAATALRETGYIEVVASELHRALWDLQELLGERVDEEVLTQVFSRFCIGK